MICTIRPRRPRVSDDAPMIATDFGHSSFAMEGKRGLRDGLCVSLALLHPHRIAAMRCCIKSCAPMHFRRLMEDAAATGSAPELRAAMSNPYNLSRDLSWNAGLFA